MGSTGRVPRLDWMGRPRDLAAIYRAYDAVLGLVDPWFTVSERVTVWPRPLTITAQSLHDSFMRLLGEPLPVALDPSPWRTADGWSRTPDSVRLPHPVFESLGFPDEDEVGRAAHDAATDLFGREPRLEAALRNDSVNADAVNTAALDEVVKVALRAAANRARESRRQTMDRRLSPPKLPQPVHVLPDVEAELYFLGVLYGVVDGIASAALDQVSSEFMGDWEAAVVRDVERSFQRAIPISTFTDSEHDWMADPFVPEHQIGSSIVFGIPRIPASRPISFDDDDESSRGPYNTDAYERIRSEAARIVEEQFEDGWEAYSDAGGEDPEAFPSERVIRRSVRLAVHAMHRACTEARVVIDNPADLTVQ